MKKLLLILTFLICFITPVFSSEEKTVVRVGISNSSFSTFEHNSVEIYLIGNSNILDMNSGEKAEFEKETTLLIEYKNGNFKVSDDKKEILNDIQGPLTITSDDKIGLKGIKRISDPAFYRGMIELKGVKPDKFNIINILDMQSYLKGVVPKEMPISFGLEALKAQAVAARNYASCPSSYYKNYDVCDSVACQVYYGKNAETAVSNRAVDETKGIYALYDNEIILALYSSTASGISEDYINTFGKGIEDKPYLKSVSDTEKLRKMDLEEYFKNSPPSFDMKSPRYRWVKEFDRFYLEDILSKTLYQQSNSGNVSPKFLKGDKLSGLEDIKVLKRGASNKALEIEIKSTSGNYIVKGELPIRRIFNDKGQILPSSNFIVEKVSKKELKEEENNKNTENNKIGAIFSSNDNDEDKVYRTKLFKHLPEAFKLYGAGFGHGVGLSQYGAGFLSYFGVPYENILKHYYTGINLGTVPKKVVYNNVNLNYTQEFYFDGKKRKIQKFNREELSKTGLNKEIDKLSGIEKTKKAYLIIENENRVSNLEFSINQYTFNPELGPYKKKYLKTDITPYLKNGINTIVFAPLSETDKKKSVRFYVVLGEEDDTRGE